MTELGLWTQRVLILRHGERQDHAPDAPPDFDPPLTTAGKAAIPASAARIKKVLGAAASRNAVLLVSPFTRCVETAIGLQHAGVGTDSAIVVDNGVCEVYGPVRIKHPERPLGHGRRTLPALPRWGETLPQASERFVKSFFRLADAYAPVASSHLGAAESESSHIADTPEAVTNRARLPARRVSSARTGNSLQSPLMDSCSTVGDGRDVIIVTHGDALSAVLNYFYPSRTVYEAEYLSFLVMKRYGLGNNVYHLDDSAGVHWILDGLDEEPADPVWRAYREAEARAALASPPEFNNGGYRISGADDFDDDFGDVEGKSSVPISSVKRVKSRAPDEVQRASFTVRVPREVATNPRAACTTPPAKMTTPTTAIPAGCGAPQVHAHHTSYQSDTGAKQRILTSPSYPGSALPPTPTKANTKKSSSGHPKGIEGCERLYSPDRKPSQSSVNDNSSFGASAQPLPESYGHPHSDSRSCQREDSATCSESGGKNLHNTPSDAPPCPDETPDAACLAECRACRDTPSDRPHHHTDRDHCWTLLKASVAFRRSCLLRVSLCLSQCLTYGAEASPEDATFYVLAVTLVEAAQGLLLFFSVESARVNRVRQCVEYLYLSKRCLNRENVFRARGDTAYYDRTAGSTPPSVAHRHEVSPQLAHENDASDPQPTDIGGDEPNGSRTVLTAPRPLRGPSMRSVLPRHLVATLLKFGVTSALTICLNVGEYASELEDVPGMLVFILVVLLYFGVNVVRGVLDERAETAWPA